MKYTQDDAQNDALDEVISYLLFQLVTDEPLSNWWLWWLEHYWTIVETRMPATSDLCTLADVRTRLKNRLETIPK